MMKYGLDVSPAGDWGRPDQIAELAALSEDHGWDGVFCEDYLAFPGGRPTYDVWITLGLVAQATTRLTLGTMVTPLPRRHPETVALQAMSVDHVLGGRLVLGVGTGDSQGDLAGMTRGGPGQRSGAILDEALDLVCRLWSGDRVSHSGEGYLVDGARLVPPPVQRPRIPIWVGGAITKQAPRDRALRCRAQLATQLHHRPRPVGRQTVLVWARWTTPAAHDSGSGPHGPAGRGGPRSSDPGRRAFPQG